MLAVFIGMTLDYFQSETFVQLHQSQSHGGREEGGSAMQDITNGVDNKNSLGVVINNRATSQEQLEREAAVEPFRVMLEQRLEFLETIAHDRPGFKGFVQGMGQYRQQRVSQWQQRPYNP